MAAVLHYNVDRSTYKNTNRGTRKNTHKKREWQINLKIKKSSSIQFGLVLNGLMRVYKPRMSFVSVCIVAVVTVKNLHKERCKREQHVILSSVLLSPPHHFSSTFIAF